MFCLSKAVQEHNSGNSSKREPRIVHENLTPAVDKKAWSRCIFAQQPNRSKQHSHIQQQSWPTGPPKPKKNRNKNITRDKNQQSWPDTRYKTNSRQKTPDAKKHVHFGTPLIPPSRSGSKIVTIHLPGSNLHFPLYPPHWKSYP